MRFVNLIMMMFFTLGMAAINVTNQPVHIAYLNPTRLEILHTQELGSYQRILYAAAQPTKVHCS